MGQNTKQVADVCCFGGNYAVSRVRNFCLLNGFCVEVCDANQCDPTGSALGSERPFVCREAH